MSMLSLEQRQRIDREEAERFSATTRAENQPEATKTIKTSVVTHEYLRDRFIPALAKATARQIRDLVQPAVDELAERIAQLETQQKAMRYRGVWQPAESYEKGNLATYDGSLWIAIDENPGKPGASGWQLAAKRGRDGKDA